MGALFNSLLSAIATIARNPYLTRHFSRQNVVYWSFSKKKRVFPDWSFLFGLFLVYFQRRNAIFVDFEERNTASVDVWVIFRSFSKEERVFPDWSSIFGSFLGDFQKRNAIFVDFEERNTASVDVWVIFGSFSKNFRITHCSLIFSGASAY